jgi:hypothetical protein
MIRYLARGIFLVSVAKEIVEKTAVTTKPAMEIDIKNSKI